jgi:cell division protein FtsI/penicillin-binding protein 2
VLLLMRNNTRNIFIILFIFIGLVYFFKNFSIVSKNESKTEAKHKSNDRLLPSPDGDMQDQPQNNFANDQSQINRHPAHITYTKHAKCRMGCRKLDGSEVKEILEKGKVNLNKSNDRPGDCPTYALEGLTHDGQHARMVFAFCQNQDVKVITVIDLDTEWPCDCK